MKSTMIKRTLVLMLTLVLVALLPVNASAASVSWTEGATYYVANVTTNSAANREVLTNIGRTHTYGTATTISPTSSSNYTVKTENQFNSRDYRDRILSALSNSGYVLSRSVTLTTSTRVVVPSTVASGYYYLAIYIHGGNISAYVTGTETDSTGVTEVVWYESYDSSYTPKTSGYTLSYIRG